MKNSEEITIRAIQHFLYCPHRWGLMEIDKAWAENYAEAIARRGAKFVYSKFLWPFNRPCLYI